MGTEYRDNIQNERKTFANPPFVLQAKQLPSWGIQLYSLAKGHSTHA